MAEECVDDSVVESVIDEVTRRENIRFQNRPKPIGEQLNILRHFLGDIGNADEMFSKNKQLPNHVQGFYALPKWHMVADTYQNAVEVIHSAISESRKGNFINHCKGEHISGVFQEAYHNICGLEKLYIKQKGFGVMVVPAQLGELYRGQSVDVAEELFSKTEDEFGLNAFDVGVILLTHPELLQNEKDLWIDCPGDISSGDCYEKKHTTSYRFGDGKLLFVANESGASHRNYGSATAFDL